VFCESASPGVAKALGQLVEREVSRLKRQAAQAQPGPDTVDAALSDARFTRAQLRDLLDDLDVIDKRLETQTKP
jgi:hypothetical protein